MAEEGKMDVVQFAEAVKAKHPEYKDVPNLVLTSKMLQKFPEYKSKINTVPKAENPDKYKLPWDQMTGPVPVAPRVINNMTHFPGQVLKTALGSKDPLDAIKNLNEKYVGGPMQRDFAKSEDFYKQEQAAAASGNKEAEIQAAHGKNIHAIGSAIPLVGPMAADIVDRGFGLSSGHPDKAALLEFPAYVLGGKAMETVGGAALDKGADILGNKAREYSSKEATKMTTTTGAPGQIMDRKTGVDIPNRIAEQTKVKDVTGLKNAADVYTKKAEDAKAQVDNLAMQMDQKGLHVTGTGAQVIQMRIDKIFEKSKTLRDAVDFGQAKFPGWGKRLGVFKASEIAGLKNDLELITKDEGKATPLAKEAQALRDEIDKNFDKLTPGWKDANEKLMASDRAKEAMETRHDNAQRGIFSEAASRIMGTMKERIVGATELATVWGAMHAAGVHGYPLYLAATVLLGAGKGIYHSVPSQMWRIAFSDALADQLIGKRAPKGPAGWPAMGGAPIGPGGPGGGPGGPGGGGVPPGPGIAGPGGKQVGPAAPTALNPQQQQQIQAHSQQIIGQAASQAIQKAKLTPAQILAVIQNAPEVEQALPPETVAKAKAAAPKAKAAPKVDAQRAAYLAKQAAKKKADAEAAAKWAKGQ